MTDSVASPSVLQSCSCKYAATASGLRDTGHSQCTPESAASHRLSEAMRDRNAGVLPGREPAGRIGDDVDSIGILTYGRFDSALGAALMATTRSNSRGWRALPATHAGAHRIRTTYHCESLPLLPAQSRASDVISG